MSTHFFLHLSPTEWILAALFQAKWITWRRMDLSELGEAAAFLRRSQAELLLLQAKAFNGKTCGGCCLHFILPLLGGSWNTWLVEKSHPSCNLSYLLGMHLPLWTLEWASELLSGPGRDESAREKRTAGRQNRPKPCFLVPSLWQHRHSREWAR